MNELRKISTVLRAVRLTIWAGRTPRHDRLFLHWLYRCAVAILAIVAAVQVARADVPPAYPPQNTPAIQQMATARTGQGFHFQGQYITPDSIRSGQPVRVFNRATPSLGQRSHPVQLTDNYGNVARGQVQTQTQIPGGAGGSVMNKAVTGLIVGDMAGKVINSHGAQNAAKALAEGNYSEAALSAGAAFDVFDVGSGLNSGIVWPASQSDFLLPGYVCLFMANITGRDVWAVCGALPLHPSLTCDAARGRSPLRFQACY